MEDDPRRHGLGAGFDKLRRTTSAPGQSVRQSCSMTWSTGQNCRQGTAWSRSAVVLGRRPCRSPSAVWRSPPSSWAPNWRPSHRLVPVGRGSHVLVQGLETTRCPGRCCGGRQLPAAAAAGQPPRL